MRDLRQLTAIEYLADMRRLMTALCLRIGGLLNQAELSRDLALPASTVQRYLNLLEMSYHWCAYPATCEPDAEVDQSDKAAGPIRALRSTSQVKRHRGARIWRNLVLTDLLAWSDGMSPRPNILHWRMQSGAKIDFVVELSDRLLPIKVKVATRVTHADVRHLWPFLSDYDDEPPAALLQVDSRAVSSALNVTSEPVTAVRRCGLL